MYAPITLLSLVAAAAAFPQGFVHAPRSAINPWTAPGPSDSRGPCPMLNTLANHGYLSHSGRNLTAQDIADAVSAGLNFSSAFGLAFGAQAMALLGGPSAIDLEDLNAPDATEHRASLTRDDHASGDSLHADPGRVRALLADASGGSEYLDVASLARSRARVEALSGPPALEGLAAQQAAGEAALLLLAMAEAPVPVPAAPINSTADAAAAYGVLKAPKDQVAAWLTDEKLPAELGWRAAERELALADVQGVSAAVAVAKEVLLSS